LNIFQNIKIPFGKKTKPIVETIKEYQHFCSMFIKNSICSYNAQELLSNASRLAFALNAWVALILIMELTIVLLPAEKENQTENISTHCFGFA
jgi:hypothetical protein